MAPPPSTDTPNFRMPTPRPPKPRPFVCFSFAAYAKTLIDRLVSLNIPVLPGLTDEEITAIEGSFEFAFPPDLRSILQVGLPVGPHFPNWRSSSPQQIRVLLSLPLLNISKNISRHSFWSDSWGAKPQNDDGGLSFVEPLLRNAPVLVPIYRNCYIPSTKLNLAGNPVFYVDGESVRVLSFDVTGFFQQFELFLQGGGGGLESYELITLIGREFKKPAHAPAWAAKAARRINFWSDAAERGRRMVERGDTHGWWCRGEGHCLGLSTCLEEMFWRLRDGGWREEEVREMMMVMDGCDGESSNSGVHQLVGDNLIIQEDLTWHVRVLSLVLLRAGWSKEDVVYALDLDDEMEGDESIGLEFHHQKLTTRCSTEEDDHHGEKISSKPLMHLLSLETV